MTRPRWRRSKKRWISKAFTIQPRNAGLAAWTCGLSNRIQRQRHKPPGFQCRASQQWGAFGKFIASDVRAHTSGGKMSTNTWVPGAFINYARGHYGWPPTNLAPIQAPQPQGKG